MNKNVGIARAVDALGGVPQLANVLGISAQAVYQMLSGKRPVPAERAVEIEAATQGVVRCEEMRPDVEWAILRHGNQGAPNPTEAQSAEVGTGV